MNVHRLRLAMQNFIDNHGVLTVKLVRCKFETDHYCRQAFIESAYLTKVSLIVSVYGANPFKPI